MSRARAFTITVFNMPEKGELQHYMLDKGTQYHMFGNEVCPTTNRQHWQGWVYFKNARSLKSVIKQFKPHHIEKCQGEIDDNVRYCTKDQDWFEEGTRPKHGNRTDIEIALTRTSIREHFREDIPNWQTLRVLENRLLFMHEVEARPPIDPLHIMHAEWCQVWSTMTAQARQEIYVKATYDDNWPGYDGQRHLVFFHGRYSSRMMEDLCDGQPVTVRTNFTYRPVECDTITIVEIYNYNLHNE